MEKVLGVFKPKPTPQEQLREWQRKLRQEARNVERQVRGNLLSYAHTLTVTHTGAPGFESEDFPWADRIFGHTLDV